MAVTDGSSADVSSSYERILICRCRRVRLVDWISAPSGPYATSSRAPAVGPPTVLEICGLTELAPAPSAGRRSAHTTPSPCLVPRRDMPGGPVLAYPRSPPLSQVLVCDRSLAWVYGGSECTVDLLRSEER
jgi:hypothetical protein